MSFLYCSKLISFFIELVFVIYLVIRYLKIGHPEIVQRDEKGTTAYWCALSQIFDLFQNAILIDSGYREDISTGELADSCWLTTQVAIK